MNLSEDVSFTNSPPPRNAKIPIWALGSPHIGMRPQIPENVLNYLASIFQIPPQMLCSRAANLGMLLGLDCNRYLLKPLDRLNGAHISTPLIYQT